MFYFLFFPFITNLDNWNDLWVDVAFSKKIGHYICIVFFQTQEFRIRGTC